MKAPIKPFFLLFSLVLTIYVMRHGDISVGGMVRRALQEYRPSASLCKGTSLEQVYTQSEIDRAQSFKDNLQSMRGGNPMMEVLTEKSVTDSQTYVDYLKDALAFIVPWGALFIISILSSIVITCNWCCIYGCCKNAKCCKCCKEPKDSSKKRIYVFISTIFALGGIGSGIAGIIVASGVPKGIELTMCSTIAIAEDLAYGVPAQDWLGVSGAINSVNDLLAKFDDVVNNVTQSTASTTDLTTAKSDVDTQVTNMKNALNVNLNKPARPDPNYATSTYAPTYIQNLTETNVTYSMTLMITNEVELRYNITKDALAKINSAVSDITTQSATVKNDIVSGKSTLEGYSNDFQSALRSVGDYGSIGKTVITGIGAGLTAIFAATLTFSIFAVGAMIMVGLLKMKSFNKFLHSSWMGFTLMSIFGFLLSTILYPLSLVSMEACDVLQSALNDSTVMSKLMGNAGGDDIGPVIDLCINGGGDIIGYFKLNDTLKQFKEINDQFTNIENDMPFDGSIPPSLTLAYQDALVAAYKAGIAPDAPEIITDLISLNSVVRGCSSDTWVLNSTNCTNSDGTKFESTNLANYNLGNPTCIGFDAWTAGHSPLDRYSSSSCGNAVTFVNNFETNRGNVDGVMSRVRTQLDLVQGEYDTFANETRDILVSILGVKDQLTNVEASLYDDNTGLFRNMNCSFVGSGLKRLSNSMCVGFISSLYQTSVVIIICSVMSLFGSIFVFCLAKRFILEDPNSKPKPV